MYTLKRGNMIIKANVSFREALEKLQSIGRNDYTQMENLAIYIGQSQKPIVTGQNINDYIGTFFC